MNGRSDPSTSRGNIALKMDVSGDATHSSRREAMYMYETPPQLPCTTPKALCYLACTLDKSYQKT